MSSREALFIQTLEKALPAFRDSPLWQRDLPYDGAGTFAIILRELIERLGGAPSSDVDDAFQALNALAHEDDDVTMNLLCVGVFEVLADSDAATQMALRRLKGPALNAFKSVLKWPES